MTDRKAVFVSHVPLTRRSGGGIYSQGVFNLFGRILSTRALTAPDKTPDPSRLVCVARAVWSGQPSRTEFSAATGLAKILARSNIAENDILILNGPDPFPLVERAANGSPIVLICHNLEADLFARQLARLPLPLRLLLKRDAERYSEVESRAVKAARLIVAISDHDAAVLRDRYPCVRIVHVPPTFDALPSGKLDYRPRSPLRFGFVGKMNWWPNRDAVEWLTSELLQPMPPGRELHLFGEGSAAWNDPGNAVHGHGFVSDASAIWNNIDVMLSPMREGGGVNIKVVDTLVRRAPLATTPFGLKGLALGIEDRPGLRILDGADAWRGFLSGEDAVRFAHESPDPDLAEGFLSKRYEARLRQALADADLLV